MTKKKLKKPQLKLLVGAWHLLRQVMAFGNPTAGGFPTMDAALRAVAELNRRIEGSYGLELAVSAHLWHELIAPPNEPAIGYSAQWNNPRAIDLNHWLQGAEQGIYPRIGRIIPPGFGLPGSDGGMFINPSSARRQLANDAMVYCFGQSKRVQKAGHEGRVIFWTGPDGVRYERLTEGKDVALGHDRNPKLEEWSLIIKGVTNAIIEAVDCGYVNPTDNRHTLLFEGKPAGDPCYLDAFTDTYLEIKGINEINGLTDAVVRWQGEFCHSRGSGQRFCDALQQAIAAGVFGGQIHLNSGGLGAVNFTQLLARPQGVLASALPQYVDNDFLPGEGVAEWLDDQRRTIALGAKWSAETGQPFEVEFDARFCRYADATARLEKSVAFTVDTFNKAAEQLPGGLNGRSRRYRADEKSPVGKSRRPSFFINKTRRNTRWLRPTRHISRPP